MRDDDTAAGTAAGAGLGAGSREGAGAGATVLVVEDDRELRDMLERLLMDTGYVVDTAADGQIALHRIMTRPYDAVVLDRGLPAIEGVDLTRRLRQSGVRTPILILTAYGSVRDVVDGLDAGADDYLVKPFEVDILLARVRALVRRTHAARTVHALGAGSVDVAERIATRADGRTVELSGRECGLLRVLAATPNRVYSRKELKDRVFDTAESDSIVDTYVHYLRRKLGNGVVRTVRGVGYRAGKI